mmetsp:Transcript_72382/g.209538  ORF Transcript_72382/g.209538 Transcript_72382/m.209538 type:complete len:224 (-) Transcript_72382:39-710(-)
MVRPPLRGRFRWRRQPLVQQHADEGQGALRRQNMGGHRPGAADVGRLLLQGAAPGRAGHQPPRPIPGEAPGGQPLRGGRRRCVDVGGRPREDRVGRAHHRLRGVPATDVACVRHHGPAARRRPKDGLRADQEHFGDLPHARCERRAAEGGLRGARVRDAPRGPRVPPEHQAGLKGLFHQGSGRGDVALDLERRLRHAAGPRQAHRGVAGLAARDRHELVPQGP